MKKGLLVSPFICVVSYFSFSQNVGIGTTSPTRGKLEVYGAISATTAIFGGESSGVSFQQNWPSIGFNEYYNNSGRYISNGFAANQYLDPNSGELGFIMIPTGTANATISPFNYSLIFNSIGNLGIRGSPAGITLYTTKSGNFEGSAVFGGTTYNSHFHYSNTEDVYIRGGKSGSRVIINDIPTGKIVMGDGSAKVGLNNGVPAYPLEIRQHNGRGILLVEPNNSFNNWELRAEKACCNPANESDLNLIYNGQYKGYFSYGNGAYITYSDRRLKTNIQRMPDVVNKVMQLQPVEYEMKSGNTNHKKTIGFIAQEVKEIFPELVTITTNTRTGYPGINDLRGLDYNGFGAVAIKALQEQQEKIKTLKQRNAELEKRITEAEKILNHIR